MHCLIDWSTSYQLLRHILIDEKPILPFTRNGKYVTKVQKLQTEFQIHDFPRYDHTFLQLCKPESIIIFSIGHKFPCFGCREALVA